MMVMTTATTMVLMITMCLSQMLAFGSSKEYEVLARCTADTATIVR